MPRFPFKDIAPYRKTHVFYHIWGQNTRGWRLWNLSGDSLQTSARQTSARHTTALLLPPCDSPQSHAIFSKLPRLWPKTALSLGCLPLKSSAGGKRRHNRRERDERGDFGLLGLQVSSFGYEIYDVHMPHPIPLLKESVKREKILRIMVFDGCECPVLSFLGISVGD